jgi:hypothetical protein
MVIEPMARAFVVAGMKAAAIVGARDRMLSTVNDMDVQHRDTARAWRANGWAIERESGLGRDFINPSMRT